MSRSFTLQVESITLARLDLNASSVQVLVPASNNPHGSVQYVSSNPVVTSEGAMPLQLNIIRMDGLIGTLRINVTAIPDSANGMDFNLNQLCESVL